MPNNRLSTAFSALVIVSLVGTGCTTNPFTGEQQVSKTAIGAGIGAGAGAVVGWISGKDKKESKRRALIGAGVGALAGGAVGAYMDIQEKKLREQLQKTGVSVTRKGDDITLNMPGNITFASNRADLNGGFYQVLNSVSLVLKEYDKTLIEVAGHTDSKGTDEYNQQLSQRRAESVTQYLVSRGVKNERIIPVGAGEKHPVASNDTEVGRSQNRRVELTLTPLRQS
jgi:outer membrane protein OmpA-like peptidoglycan-associated protein